MPEIEFFYVPCPSLDVAREIAKAVIERRLASCANLIESESVYRWNGALQCENEVVVVAKTTQERSSALREALIAVHPYEIPCISHWSVAVNLPFADWVAGEVGESHD